jgi:UDP-N-acetylmuramoyl-tripeptide--D-alanyl-D-alanine ligase
VPVRYLLDEVAEAIGGELEGDPDVEIRGVSTDSRTLKRGDLFFALRGPNFDGTAFAQDALSGGAAAVVLPKEAERISPSILVEDTLLALGKLARYHRGRLTEMKVVAITGSVGKSTTREMLTALLARRFRTAGGIKSFNNAVGVPLTLFNASDQTEVLVCELGSNHPGEMAYLSALVGPDTAILTRVGRSHLEFFGDMEGVAWEKSALFASLRGGGLAVLNADSPHLDIIEDALGDDVRRIRFAFDHEAEYHANGFQSNETHSRFKLKGQQFEIPLPGHGFAEDALAALAAANELGIPLEDGARTLREFRSLDMRMERSTIAGVDVINDAYNASPDAVNDLLKAIPERTNRLTVFILGDMLELGSGAEEMHREIGRHFVALDHRFLITFGDKSRHITDAAREAGLKNAHHMGSLEEIVDLLSKELGEGDRIVLKASRALELERLLDLLRKRIA